jgi:hypothetical protein
VSVWITSMAVSAAIPPGSGKSTVRATPAPAARREPR